MSAAVNVFRLSEFHLHCYHDQVISPRAFFTKSLLAIVLALGLPCFASGPDPAANLPAIPTTVDSITARELRGHLEFLSSTELGGRYTLSPNFAIAARYLASELESYGFHGAAANGSFLQKFEVVTSKPDPAYMSLELNIEGKRQSATFGQDFFTSSNAGNGAAQGELVYVGGGISAPALKRDDYAGKDVKGKIVILVSGAAGGVDIAQLKENERGAGAAQAHGAAGILIVPPQRVLNLMKDRNLMQRLAGRESVSLAEGHAASLPGVTLGPDLTEKVLAAFGLTPKQAYEGSESAADKCHQCSVKFYVAVQQNRKETQNVAGILEGTDPQLKNEYVTFSAHYDHLKTGPSGEIYHGADDDGSGTSAVLAIAKAMSMNRPRRSVLIIFHAGEELGLLGSEYNADYAPVVPLDKIVVDLNIDMIGRSKPPGDKNPADEHLTDANSVYLVGSNRISKELDQISEETNQQFQKLRLDYYYNDPSNPERIYYRSDHWNYAKHGIPIIFYFSGTHVDYHQPTDTIDKIDFNKMMEVTRLVFETGWRIANLDHRLTKN